MANRAKISAINPYLTELRRIMDFIAAPTTRKCHCTHRLASVAKVISPPTRDQPRKVTPVANVVKKRPLNVRKPKIKTSREATVPSPDENLFKSSLPRYLVSSKATRKTPSPPPKPVKNKPEITPSTWRQDLKILKEIKTTENQNKNNDVYSDDFESEDEKDNAENKQNRQEKPKKTPVRFVFKAKSPPAPKMPEPKVRHYDPVQVKKYISQQRRQRLQEKSKIEKDKQNKEEKTKQQLFQLQNRTKQILEANVKQSKHTQEEHKSAEEKYFSQSPVVMKDLQLNFNNLKSPSVSSRHSSMRESSNNRLSDEFIKDFVNLHQPRPAHQEILSRTNLLMDEVSTCIKANSAATKIQAAFRGHLVRKRMSRRVKQSVKAAPPKFVPSFEFLEKCLRETKPDPFSFIQTVKRKLSEAANLGAEKIKLKSPEKSKSEEENNKYESDFESSDLSISPSEEIIIGSDSRPGSRHSLVSITPDRNEEISKIAAKESSSSVTSVSSPSQLVPPNVGLVVQGDVLNGQRPASGPEGQSASSASTISSSSIQSEVSAKSVERSQGDAKMVSYTVYQSGRKTIKVPHLKKPAMNLFETPPVSEIRACFQNKSIEELEASIIAGFTRLGEEMNATRALFNLPLPLMEPPKISPKKPPTLQDVLPQLTTTLENICLVVPKLTEKAQNLIPKSPSIDEEGTEGDDIDDIKDDSEISSSTITEDKKDAEVISEKTSSGGLPRVTEAIMEFEMSVQSAQGSLKILAEQESVEEISERDYSSKFEEESEIAEDLPPGSDTPTVSDVLTEINGQDRPHRLSKSKSLSSTKDSPKYSSGGSGGDQDSFTVFSLAMFQQLVRDQELRARQQRALLKQREDAIYEKSKAELIFLENQKKEMRLQGTENLIPGIKKRQRAILLRLNQERDEIKRLRESHKIASQERKLMLQQQHHIAKMKLAAKEIAHKLHGKDLSTKSQRLLEPSRWAVPELSEEESSGASISLDTSDLSQSKASSGAEDTGTGSLRDVLNGLKRGEKGKRQSESKGKEKAAKLQKHDTKQSAYNDQSTSPVQPSVEVTQSATIPESIDSAQESNQIVVRTDSEIYEPQSPTPIEVSSLEAATKDLEVSKEASTIATQQEASSSAQELSQESSAKSVKTPITIKVPLSPRLHNRQKRRHSSGSDESIVLSQNETASEQSDVESRICALQEQLRRRKMEAERLRKEQKRCHRERLRAKEQSLLKQIQAYDTYIQETRRELEQEFENGNSVKPQIKHPRVAEKVRPVKMDNFETVVAEVKITEQLKIVESEIKEVSTHESSEVKEELSANVKSTESEKVSSPPEVLSEVEVSEESEIIKTEVEDEESTVENVSEEKEEEKSEERTMTPEVLDQDLTPVLTSENIPDIPTDLNVSKLETAKTLEEEEEEDAEDTVNEETLISEAVDEALAKCEAVSPVSIEGSQASVETTIETPRKSSSVSEIVEEQQILASVASLKKIVDEEEVDKITDCLMRRLLEDTLRLAQADREEGKEKSLREELEVVTAETVKEPEPERVKSISPPTSSILDRVHSLLAENGAGSPRDKNRPQDFMGLTFVEDSLSPEPGFEVPGVCEEILSAASPIVISPPTSLQKVDLQEGLKEDKTEAASKEEPGKDDPAQEWFDEDFGLSSTRKEAEQLRLKQLQIEQEIQLLQSQQFSYCYVREIPNKPPPPYTPPGETPRSQDDDSLSVAVPNTKEEILPLVLTATERFYHARLAGRDLGAVQPLVTENEDPNEPHAIYNRFLSDLGKQLVEEAYSLPEENLSPWLEPASVKRRNELLRPKSLQELQLRVENQVCNLFGFTERRRKEKLIIRWSRKRRDHVDELLVREAQEEEQAWTNYEMDEAAVKSQLVDTIFNQVLRDTVAEVEKEFRQKYGQS
ncbi:centrosome-associated protein 350-like isoform X2 [Neocloeon triangulifer]|uniref:centrosome-associated protein 350-like isoform X2 n=1 Tax=Neocloeon triangulifer TaxID=2078957 RepID=UPI00286F96D7|nr:centrosome-associated protein 350-like isoform X2 [Neocloeon triangulifer]